ncbi:AtpZ/AtpI family protein [Sphingomonas sp. PB4P5]|uniref:AtpZ/AtpI family protein n=1 Tax=Parasphingomonas puruogangriensis TaxID=3096155 RepID=UPI002FCAE45C
MSDNRHTDDLTSRIAKARDGEQARGGEAKQAGKGYSQGGRVLSLLLGGLLGGGIIGWAIDHWFDTSPWGLLIVLTLAIIGAFVNIMKISKERAE